MMKNNNFKATLKTSRYLIYKMCNEYNFYTSGDSIEYENILNYVEKLEEKEISLNDIEFIATNISEHSSHNYSYDSCDIKSIINIILNEYCYCEIDRI